MSAAYSYGDEENRNHLQYTIINAYNPLNALNSRAKLIYIVLQNKKKAV